MFSCDCISMTCCTHGLEALVIYTVSWLVRYRLSKLDHPINQWRPFELNEIPAPQGQVPIMVDLLAALRSNCLPVFGVLCFAAFWNFWPAPSSKNVLWMFFGSFFGGFSQPSPNISWKVPRVSFTLVSEFLHFPGAVLVSEQGSGGF